MTIANVGRAALLKTADCPSDRVIVPLAYREI
jgi:hypothetical protein